MLAWLPERRLALHRAQLRVYGALLCRSEGLAQVELALVYLDLVSGDGTVLVTTEYGRALSAVPVDSGGYALTPTAAIATVSTVATSSRLMPPIPPMPRGRRPRARA